MGRSVSHRVFATFSRKRISLLFNYCSSRQRLGVVLVQRLNACTKLAGSSYPTFCATSLILYVREASSSFAFLLRISSKSSLKLVPCAVRWRRKVRLVTNNLSAIASIVRFRFLLPSSTWRTKIG